MGEIIKFPSLTLSEKALQRLIDDLNSCPTLKEIVSEKRSADLRLCIILTDDQVDADEVLEAVEDLKKAHKKEVNYWRQRWQKK